MLEATVKVETVVEAMVAKARVDIGPNLRAGLQDQALAQIVVQVTLSRGARNSEKNATIVIKRPFFLVLQV